MLTYLPYILTAVIGVILFAYIRLQQGTVAKCLEETEIRLSDMEIKLTAIEASCLDEIRKSGEEKDLKITQLREDLRSVLNSFVEKTGKKLAENAALQKSRFEELSERISALRQQEPTQPERSLLPPKKDLLVETSREKPEPFTSAPVVKTPPITPAPETPRSTESTAQAKAKRLARLIVSDIVLYNQAAVDESIRTNTFEEVMAHEIREARKLYEQRVPPEVRSGTAYLDDAFGELIARKKREFNIN